MVTIRGWLLFEVQTSRLLFFSALPQCGDYSRAATIQSTDVAATIYFSSTAMRRLLEGRYYSKCRRRGYYLFQLYRNVVTIQGRLLFKVQTSRLQFISALLQCGDYSRAATIRGADVAATIYFSATAMGDNSRAATIRSADVAATIYFSATAMRLLFKGGYYSRCRRHGYYLFQLYRNGATIRGRLLFEVQTSRLLFISALPQCGYYSRAATIRGADVTATIYFSSTAMGRQFEGGYYSRCRRRGYYLFQLYRNGATIRGWLLFGVQTSRLLFISALPQWVTIRGWLLFEVQTSRLLFISALPQWGDNSRVATIRGADVTATIYFSSTAMGDNSRVATIRGADVTATIYFSSTAMGDNSRAATIRGAEFIRRNTVLGFLDQVLKILKQKSWQHCTLYSSYH